MYLTEFVDSVKRVKNNWEPYKQWEKEQEDREAQHKELANRVHVPKDELDKASNYGRTLIDAVNVMDTYSINRAQDVEMASKAAIQAPLGFLSVLPVAASYLVANSKYVQNSKSPKAIKAAAYGLGILSMLMIQTLGLSYTKHLEKQASRIARYQSRETELKDPRNFVVYNNDQINAAKAIARSLPDPPPEKKKSFLNINESIASIKSLFNDKQNYEIWKTGHMKAERERKKLLPDLNISSEQLDEAKKHQQSILGAIKHIEITSQNYLNRTEMAINTLFCSDLLLGFAAGGIASRVIPLLQEYNIISKTSKFANKAVMYAPMVGPAILTIASIPLVVPALKEAAKIGRFKAKQELLKDPRNFIAYNDEQIDSVKNIKAEDKPQRNILGKVVDQFKFLFQLVKDHKEFKEYNKTGKVQEEKLDKALKQIELAPGQLEEAKLLQKNTFMAFEKMDEKAQRYADDIEGATEIAQNLSTPILELLVGGATIGAATLIEKKSPPISPEKKMTLYKWIVAIPVVGSVLASILMMAYSTKIKQQSVKIGLMEAMEDLKDPKNFTSQAH